MKHNYEGPRCPAVIVYSIPPSEQQVNRVCKAGGRCLSMNAHERRLGWLATMGRSGRARI